MGCIRTFHAHVRGRVASGASASRAVHVPQTLDASSTCRVAIGSGPAAIARGSAGHRRRSAGAAHSPRHGWGAAAGTAHSHPGASSRRPRAPRRRCSAAGAHCAAATEHATVRGGSTTSRPACHRTSRLDTGPGISSRVVGVQAPVRRVTPTASDGAENPHVEAPCGYKKRYSRSSISMH